jgi:hypothetical protein
MKPQRPEPSKPFARGGFSASEIVLFALLWIVAIVSLLLVVLNW